MIIRVSHVGLSIIVTNTGPAVPAPAAPCRGVSYEAEIDKVTTRLQALSNELVKKGGEN